MNVDTSLFSLFLNASLVVQAVMLLLLAVSILSWTILVEKWRGLARLREEATAFEGRFWSGIDLVELYRQVSKEKDEASGPKALFEAGFREFARLSKPAVGHPEAVVEGAQRAMRAVLNREQDRLEHHLSLLATVGSVSPYVGLFGTVWGIMNSFRALGGVQYATLSMVAPGIAEALIATAMGLFAAIPAVIAYNRFSNEVERLMNRNETFVEEFTSLLHRQVYNPALDSAA
ncbi:MAG: protein TolQ [Thiohalomonadaceae bacterium]